MNSTTSNSNTHQDTEDQFLTELDHHIKLVCETEYDFDGATNLDEIQANYDRLKENKQQCLSCSKCHTPIKRDSREHDECIIINDGGDLVCFPCRESEESDTEHEPETKRRKLSEGEEKESEKEESDEEEEEEEEPEGDYCYGASKPSTVIMYTMAGGGAHWWNYEVHFQESEQIEVYINNESGKHLQWNKRLFCDDSGNYMLLEDKDFELCGYREIELHE
jgi:hypothetical protein